MHSPDDEPVLEDTEELDPCAAGHLLLKQDELIDLFESLNPYTTKENLLKNPDAEKRIFVLAGRFQAATENVLRECNIDSEAPLAEEDFTAFLNPQVFDDLMDELAGIHSDVEELRIDLQRSASSTETTV